MSSIRHPNRQREFARACERALAKWYPGATPQAIRLVRAALPSYPLICGAAPRTAPSAPACP